MLVGREDRFATLQNAKRIKKEINKNDPSSMKLLQVNRCNHYTFNYGNMVYMRHVIDFIKELNPARTEKLKKPPEYDEGNLESAKLSNLKIRWLGHAGFRISFNDNLTGQERVIYIDPWFQNPNMPKDFQNKINQIDADLVLVTHGDFDYFTSAP